MMIDYKGVYRILYAHGRVPRAKAEAQRKWVMRRLDTMPPAHVDERGHHTWDYEAIEQWVIDNPTLIHAKLRPRKPKSSKPKPKPRYAPELRQVRLAIDGNNRRLRS